MKDNPIEVCYKDREKGRTVRINAQEVEFGLRQGETDRTVMVASDVDGLTIAKFATEDFIFARVK